MNSSYRIKWSLLVVGWLVVLCLQPSAVALQVPGLYSYQVAVSNDSDAERTRAFGEALSAVIVKVTGTERWLQDPRVQRALESAQRYVEAISYSSEFIERQAPPVIPVEAVDADTTVPAVEPARSITVEQRYVTVTFAAGLINELLTGASVPIWDSNRPSVLVWMVIQDTTGDRRLLTQETDPEIVDTIRQFSTNRGLPLIFPVLDFEDRRNLPVDALWSLDETAIRIASERYGADTILSGRLLLTASGEKVGLWQFIFQNQATVFDGFDVDLQAYLNAPLDRITNQLASYFAIVPASTDQNYVRLRVEGVDDLQAYSALLTYVRTLGLVRSVAMTSIDGARLELEVGLQGSAQQLLELIALDRDLLPITASRNSEDPVLHYRWTR